ncbi:hypothetical protein [Streptomyces violaceoruber]|uniref:hypothetical protein n=1 Tax=Streptomyces violaceoruber TaxID=1935 RepID=UPI003B431DF3
MTHTHAAGHGGDALALGGLAFTTHHLFAATPGRTLLRIVRRGRHGTIKVRRAMMIPTSSSGNTDEAIAALVAADPDTVRGVIHSPLVVGGMP